MLAAVASINAEREKAGDAPIDIKLHRVPFFLEPGYINKPDTFTESHDDRMTRKFGSLEAFNRVKAQHALIPRGMEVGLDASVGFTQEQLDKRVQSSTLASHRLVLFVEQQHGVQASEKLYDQLNQRHFLQAGVLNDRTLLSASISSIGLSDEQVQALERFLDDPQRGREVTLELYQRTQSLGIDSIPTLVVDGQYMMSGAAQASEVERVLRRAIAHGLTGSRAFEARAI